MKVWSLYNDMIHGCIQDIKPDIFHMISLSSLVTRHARDCQAMLYVKGVIWLEARKLDIDTSHYGSWAFLNLLNFSSSLSKRWCTGRGVIIGFVSPGAHTNLWILNYGVAKRYGRYGGGRDRWMGFHKVPGEFYLFLSTNLWVPASPK